MPQAPTRLFNSLTSEFSSFACRSNVNRGEEPVVSSQLTALPVDVRFAFPSELFLGFFLLDDASSSEDSATAAVDVDRFRPAPPRFRLTGGSSSISEDISLSDCDERRQ